MKTILIIDDKQGKAQAPENCIGKYLPHFTLLVDNQI
jgi:hypothetical protein